MSNKTLRWIGRNLGLGGILRHSGTATGFVVKHTLRGVGAVAEGVASDSEFARGVNKACKWTGDTLDTGFKATGKGLGFVADKTIEYTGKATGSVAATAAEAMDASKETVAIAERVGTIAGAAAIGLAAGGALADAAVTVASASGTSGAAATASGLANLGGGAVATGGGGMATGTAVTQGFVAGATGSGVATIVSEDSSDDK